MVTVDGDSIRALAYPALVGSPRIGDRVLLNVGALEAGLGTGGYALVVAIPDRLPPDGDMPGHIVKSRYTPMQVMVASADEQGSPHHELLGRRILSIKCRSSWPIFTRPCPRSWRESKAPIERTVTPPPGSPMS